MERLTFFCLAGTAYLSRSYQLIISTGNYCPAGHGADTPVDAARSVQTLPASVFRWVQPEQVAKSFRAVLFSGRARDAL